MFNIITVQTTSLHTVFHYCLKIPVKVVFYHILIVINTIKGCAVFWPTLYNMVSIEVQCVHFDCVSVVTCRIV